jgi:hypothetical protein
VLVINDHSNDTKKKIRHKNSNNAPQHTNKWEWRASGPGAFSTNFLYFYQVDIAILKKMQQEEPSPLNCNSAEIHTSNMSIQPVYIHVVSRDNNSPMRTFLTNWSGISSANFSLVLHVHASQSQVTTHNITDRSKFGYPDNRV